MATNMTVGQRLHIGTQGQFGDPSNEELRPYAADLLKEIGASAMTVDQVLEMSDLRESLVNECLAAKEKKRIEAEELAKEAARCAAETKTANGKAEANRVRIAYFALKGIAPEEQKRLAVTAWAKDMGNGQVVELPAARQHEGNDVCGAPDSVGCCDHTGKVLVWAILPHGEPPYGLCETLKSVYDELYELSDGRAKVFLHSPNKVGLEAKAAYRKEKEVPVRVFVRNFAELQESELSFIPQPKLGDDGKHLCAMGGKIPCCDGNQPARHFFHWKGTIYGGCYNYVGATFAEQKNNPDAHFKYRIKSGAMEDTKKTVEHYFVNQAKMAKLEQFARGYAVWDSEVPTPEPHGAMDGYGNIIVHKCAAFKAGWGCCVGEEPVERGSTLEGVVRGFCRASSSAMFHVWLAMKNAFEESSEAGQAPNHLRTAVIAQAIEWAEQYHSRNSKGGDRPKQSPLGNKTKRDGERQLVTLRERVESFNKGLEKAGKGQNVIKIPEDRFTVENIDWIRAEIDRQYGKATRGAGGGGGKNNRKK